MLSVFSCNELKFKDFRLKTLTWNSTRSRFRGSIKKFFQLKRTPNSVPFNLIMQVLSRDNLLC